MEPYSKYDISTPAVLEVFMTKADHELSWLDLAWIYDAAKGTGKATELEAIIEDLANKTILERQAEASWRIVDIQKAQRALLDLTQEPGSLDLKSDKAISNPTTQNISNPPAAPKGKSRLVVITWIVVIIIALIIIYFAFK